MANFEVTCYECKNTVTANVADSTYSNSYRWYLSYNCEICDTTVEFDEIGKLPGEIKNAIVGQEGLWGMILTDVKKLNKVVFLLRNDPIFISDTAESELNNSVMTKILFKGTRNEVMWLTAKLLKKGIEGVEIKKFGKGVP